MPKIPTDETVDLPAGVLKKISEAACGYYCEREARAKQESKDSRLYNARLLLKNYLGLKKYCEGATYDAMHVNEDEEMVRLIELMARDKRDGVLTVDAIRERVVKIRIILHHTDKMLEFYKHRCRTSNKVDERRKWDTVYYMYLIDDAEKENVDELAVRFGVDERTVYRYINGALEDLSALFFGYIG